MKEQYLKALELDGDDFWTNAARKLIEPLSEEEFAMIAQQGFSAEAFRMAAFAREFISMDTKTKI